MPSPEWTKNLVICEISTKIFNSPQKSETGTFNSLKSKILYLAKVGINCIWLKMIFFLDWGIQDIS